MTHASRPDVLVVGGGIIGLSIALELADRGAKVKLIDRGEPGREASWAGAGILPPGSGYSGHPALEAMAARSNVLHPRLSGRLREETGIDDGYVRCGAIYMTTSEPSDGESETLMRWRARGAVVEPATPSHLSGLAVPPQRAAHWVPAEASVRNPRRLKALVRLCELAGVSVEAGVEARSLRLKGSRVASVVVDRGELCCGAVCLAAGCWSGPLAERLGMRAPVRPIKGQIALLRGPVGLLPHVVHDGDFYLTPRADGRVVVGSTVEDVGFDKTTEADAISALVGHAHRLAPALRQTELESCWAGLRPASCDGLPILGRIAGYENAYIGGGHFRAGLHLAPSTAELVCGTIEGKTLEPPFVDLAASRF
ncbi:Hydrogen cyanide synthase subunit HcnC precursor [Pirellulimonas nuda]|uniref:Hydrogen cyanide synthase subunit HcnC n=1 Tax=Pirellulimonas nuda TaxID=2528009 RepID=A0A518DAU5_9BACT|nr:glycine oxidase ThiO [Pirellulimonas nuda]QDU88592.1 Hydrogen cyanide synthase subunit HcnC precursor [Pirellulimonas nuda]